VTEAPAYQPLPETAPQPQQADRITRWSDRLVMNTPKWLAPLAVLGCAAGAVGYTLWSNPTSAGADSIPSCLVKLTTGLDCPGCGGTRAAWYLLHGDLPAASRHHLLFVFVVPVLVYVYIAWAGKAFFNWKIPVPSFNPAVMGWLLGAWALFMVVRNLPWAPFTYFFV
jgi:hypothetical protein